MNLAFRQAAHKVLLEDDTSLSQVYLTVATKPATKASGKSKPSLYNSLEIPRLLKIKYQVINQEGKLSNFCLNKIDQRCSGLDVLEKPEWGKPTQSRLGLKTKSTCKAPVRDGI